MILADEVSVDARQQMLESLDINEEASQKASEEDPCWDGYEMQGTKEQDGETVPNCVPKSDSKASDFVTNVYRVEGTDDFEGQTIGVAFDLPNSEVYVDWKNDEWPDDQQLDGAHVSIYSSIKDLEQATGNVVIEVDQVTLDTLETKMEIVKAEQVPDEAVSYSDESDVPENARTIEGPRGGDYYIPGDKVDPTELSPDQILEDESAQGRADITSDVLKSLMSNEEYNELFEDGTFEADMFTEPDKFAAEATSYLSNNFETEEVTTAMQYQYAESELGLSRDSVGVGDDVQVMLPDGSMASGEIVQGDPFKEVEVNGDSLQFSVANEDAVVLAGGTGATDETVDGVDLSSDLDNVDETDSAEDIVDAMDIDFSERTEFGELSEDQQNKLKDSLAEVHGEESTEQFFSLVDDWKASSSGDAGAKLEAAFDQALDLPGETYRAGDAEVDQGVADVARTMQEASQRQFREEFGDSKQVHRGVSEEAWEDYDGGEIEMSSMAIAESGFGDVAESFADGRDTATVSWTVEPEDVVFQMDALTSFTGSNTMMESEIQVAGGSIEPDEVNPA